MSSRRNVLFVKYRAPFACERATSSAVCITWAWCALDGCVRHVYVLSFILSIDVECMGPVWIWCALSYIWQLATPVAAASLANINGIPLRSVCACARTTARRVYIVHSCWMWRSNDSIVHTFLTTVRLTWSGVWRGLPSGMVRRLTWSGVWRGPPSGARTYGIVRMINATQHMIIERKRKLNLILWNEWLVAFDRHRWRRCVARRSLAPRN